MSKTLSLIAIFWISIHSMSAQQELKRANNYFKRAFYTDAIPLYEQLLTTNKSMEVLTNLADSYYRTYDMHSAARWYKTIISRYGENLDVSYYFKLNQSLKAIGKYNEAENILRDFYTRTGDSSAITKLKQDHQYLENLSAIGERFTIKNLPLNSPSSEFGATLIDSMLIFTAAAKRNATIKRLYRWNNQNYLDIYTHPFNKINEGDSLSKSLSGIINTKMHEGTFTITKDRKTIYFTRNNFIRGTKKTDDKKISNLKIYKAEWSGNEWTNITELPFNSDEFSTEHPALNSDQTKLYFSSDRPGGYGSFDLYSVDILSNGLYGNPKNLGPTINTNKKEQFPYLNSEDNLYFSSNGHPGYGLLDIFISEYKDGGYKNPNNLGLPMNSGYDDFSISFYSDKQGFFSSNRPLGKGSDDIYSFVEIRPLIIEDCQQFITGTLTDQTTGKPIANGTVQLQDSQGEILKEVITNEEALFSFKIDCGPQFTVYGSKEGFQNNKRIITSTKERKKTFDGSLQLLSLVEIEKQQQIQKQKEEEAQLALEQKNRELAEKTKKEKINDIIQHENVLAREKDRTLIKTKEIHFDYSLWYLRRESRERLQVVLGVMHKYPEMIVEIGTHTDIRGDENYNRELSQKRANAVKDYLVGKGIDENRIIAKGYGESQPIVECATEEDCTEEDHEWNRRCEFVILKWE